MRKLFVVLPLAAALFAPITLNAYDHDRDRDNQRYYDPEYRDYHQWNDREDRAWRHYQEERHERYRRWQEANEDQRRAYWRWRHDHRDWDDRH